MSVRLVADYVWEKNENIVSFVWFRCFYEKLRWPSILDILLHNLKKESNNLGRFFFLETAIFVQGKNRVQLRIDSYLCKVRNIIRSWWKIVRTNLFPHLPLFYRAPSAPHLHSLSRVVVPATLTQHLCQRSFYKIFVKFRNSKKKVLKLKIILIIVDINKDENKSLISNQFSLKNDLWSFLTFYLRKIVLQEVRGGRDHLNITI